MKLTLPQPRKYFPIEKGRYLVQPGLKVIEQGQLIQIDSLYSTYIKNKEGLRLTDLANHFPSHHLLSKAELEVIEKFLLDHILTAYPQFFTKATHKLTNHLTQKEYELNRPQDYGFGDLFDLLCCQLQEDFSIWKIDEKSHKEWMASAHVFSPSHWAPNEKIGKNFADVHQPVPGIESINQHSWKYAKLMCEKGPFERFAWSFSHDQKLNHHPQNYSKDLRNVQSGLDEYYLRVERQTTNPFCDLGLCLFSIRVYHYPVSGLSRNEKELLQEALSIMSPEQKRYKGLINFNNLD